MSTNENGISMTYTHFMASFLYTLILDNDCEVPSNNLTNDIFFGKSRTILVTILKEIETFDEGNFVVEAVIMHLFGSNRSICKSNAKLTSYILGWFTIHTSIFCNVHSPIFSYEILLYTSLPEFVKFTNDFLDKVSGTGRQLFFNRFDEAIDKIITEHVSIDKLHHKITLINKAIFLAEEDCCYDLNPWNLINYILEQRGSSMLTGYFLQNKSKLKEIKYKYCKDSFEILSYHCDYLQETLQLFFHRGVDMIIISYL